MKGKSGKIIHIFQYQTGAVTILHAPSHILVVLQTDILTYFSVCRLIRLNDK